MSIENSLDKLKEQKDELAKKVAHVDQLLRCERMRLILVRLQKVDEKPSQLFRLELLLNEARAAGIVNNSRLDFLLEELDYMLTKLN